MDFLALLGDWDQCWKVQVHFETPNRERDMLPYFAKESVKLSAGSRHIDTAVRLVQHSILGTQGTQEHSAWTTVSHMNSSTTVGLVP